MSRLDFSSEGGRALFWALCNPSESKFSPLLESDHQSRRFWESNELFKQVSFPAFRGHAAEMAKIAIAQMTPEAKKAEEARIAKLTKATPATPKKSMESTGVNHKNPQQSAIKQQQSSKAQQTNNIKVPSLRDTIVASHPNGEMAIVIFELDGDTDEKACQLQFAKRGRKIKVYSRIPNELTNAASLLGNAENRKPIQDADCMLLDLAIKERLEGSRKDSNGDFWEIREVIDLPFQCKNSIFNKHRKEIPTYLLRKNDQGYAWGYFWVVAAHVGQKDKGPTKIRCQATSDNESDEVDENQSQLFSSDEELENDVDEMEIEFESTAVSCKNQTAQQFCRLKEDLEAEIRELKKTLQLKTNEVFRLKSASDTVTSKNEELKKMKDDFMCEMTSLRGLLEREQKKNMDIELKNQNEREELLRKLNAENELIISKNDELNKLSNGYMCEITNLKHLLEQQKRKCMDLETREENHRNEREKDVCKFSVLQSELQAQERAYKSTLENFRENIHQLESEIKRLKVDNQLKEKLLKESKLSSKTKEQDHNQSQQVLRDNLAALENMLQESNEKIRLLQNEATAHFENSEKQMKAIYEKDQQCIYQMDQIERLQYHVFEMEQSVLEKDSLINAQRNEIHGLKTHILHQGNCINDLEKEAESLRRSRNSIRLTSENYTDEEKKVEFDELNRWDSEKSLKSISPKNAQTDQHEIHETDDANCKDQSEGSSGDDHFEENMNINCSGTTSQQEMHETDDTKWKKSNPENAPRNEEKTDDRDDYDDFFSIASEEEDGTQPIERHEIQREEINEESCDKGLSGDMIATTDKDDREEDGIQREINKESCGKGMSADMIATTNKDDRDDSNELPSKIADEEEDSAQPIETHGIQRQETNSPHEKNDSVETYGQKTSEGNTDKGMSTDTITTQINKNKPSQPAVTFVEHDEVPAIVMACTQKKSKKRKSVTDLREEHPNKKIRKSQRLEEKRLARQMKPKID